MIHGRAIIRILQPAWQSEQFAFTGRQVNQSIGAIEVTGLFPNPGH